MRALVASCVALAAAAALAQDAGKPRSTDGGLAPRPGLKSASDAGHAADAGQTSDAGVPEVGLPPYKPTAVFVLARETSTLDKWGRSRPEQRAALPTLKSAKIGERLFLGLFVDGYQLPESRVVSLMADLVVTDCRGRKLVEEASIVRGQNFDPNLNVAAPLKPAVPLTFGLSDPVCAYTVRLKIHDDSRGMALVTEGTFDVTR